MFTPRITIGDVWAVAKALYQKELSGRSPIVKKFEAAFAKYNGVKYASATNSGSSALFLALKALDLPKGSKVICPAFGYVAVPNAIVQAGYEPVLVDVEVDTGNLDPELIPEVLARMKIEAIVCIDTYGHPCDYDKIKSFGLKVVQDAAEAIGAEYRGRKICGDIAVFSFFANKTITTGEGGMVVTNDRSIAERVSKLKDQCGCEVRYWHTDPGYSLCMGALQAALGLSQLKKIDKILEEKRSKIKGLIALHGGWFIEKPYAKHGCWAFGMMDRSKNLTARYENVEFRPFFFPINELPMYLDGKKYPVAKYLSENGVYLLT